MKGILNLSASLTVVAATSVIVPPRVSYDGYKVVRLAVEDKVDQVNDIVARLGLTTWKGAPRAGAFADIVISPEQVNAFINETAEMRTLIMHEDLGVSIAEESTFQTYSGLAADAAPDSTWFESYHAYEDHMQYLQDLQTAYSSNAELFTVGNSLKGNAITGVHIWGSSGKGQNPAVYFHGTVHAREWIATMVVEYLAYSLLSGYASDAEITAYVDKYDFYIIPVVNADGFLYTQTTDRLWRKNRQNNKGSSCDGRDINRNWPYQWDVPGGASTDPCADDYKGVSAGDAFETKLLYTDLQNVKNAQGLKLYIDYHSYSQLFMTPYGYSCDAVAANNDELQSLASGAVAAIEAVNGASYTPGPICSTIYQATGTSVDYVADVVKADYMFACELRDTGNYGFVLPASQIAPTCEENFAAVKYLLKNMN